MQEDFLHYIWLYKKINLTQLKTTKGLDVILKSVGQHNKNSGPDFFNSHMIIGEQFWAGNVEIHIKSSDWYVHEHETDLAYDNVILHVVWEHDVEIFRKNNSEIPTLELKNIVQKTFYKQYINLMSKKQRWINCENSFGTIPDFTFKNWLERLYLERLESKSYYIDQLLFQTKNNWESVLYQLLVRNFGLKINADVFSQMAKSVDYNIVRKQQGNILSLEALFFGQANLLNEDIQDGYYAELQKEYGYLKKKFRLVTSSTKVQFFRLRPASFPTIRLSQLSNLYAKHQQLFSKLMKAKSVEAIHTILDVGVSEFWETHYTFLKSSKFQKKIVSKKFKNLLIINAILPLKYNYSVHQGVLEFESFLEFVKKIPLESNGTVTKFLTLKSFPRTALQSQALLELKSNYCDKNKCIQCAIGNTILKQK